jgi:hypothetical protein
MSYFSWKRKWSENTCLRKKIMWIIRFHLLQTKHYNKITRTCKKHGFIPRKIAPTVFAKACLLHCTQKTSWRALGREFWVDHILLYRFYNSASNTGLLEEIIHIFFESHAALYIGDLKQINIGALDNSSEIYDLTMRQLSSILPRI